MIFPFKLAFVRYFATTTNSKLVLRDGTVARVNLSVVCKHSALACRKNMKDFGATAYRHALDKRLMVRSGEDLEDQNAEKKEASGDWLIRFQRTLLG